jgi:hypothetical protein
MGGTVHFSTPSSSAAEDIPRRVMRIRKIAAIISAVIIFVRSDYILERACGGRVGFGLLEKREVCGRL